MTTELTELVPEVSLAEAGGERLWMERGFSRREIGQRMLSAVAGMEVISTPEQPVPGTEVLRFPVFKEVGQEAGVAILNNMVERYNITAIWPQRSAYYDLSEINCTVHVPASPETINLIDDKVAFMEWLGNDNHRLETAEAVGVDAVKELFYERKAQNKETCVKPVVGVNGEGFWRITDTAATTFLMDPIEREIHPDVYFTALAVDEAVKGPQRLAVMDWLPGPEVSIDLLCWYGRPLIHAARTKIDADHQRIQAEHPVLSHTHMVASRLALHGIVSMQYRLDTHGNWKMLEINPRPAGGSIHSEDAGFGIISEWAQLVAGIKDPQQVAQHHDDVLLEFQRVATRIS